MIYHENRKIFFSKRCFSKKKSFLEVAWETSRGKKWFSNPVDFIYVYKKKTKKPKPKMCLS
jgi:hypothetical protein